VHRTLRGIAGIFAAGRLARRASTGMAATVLLVAGLVLPGAVSQAGQERYEYDPIGRLVRFVDSNNQVTDYRYDAAGNILSVTRASAASLAPSIATVAPSVIRRGETRVVTLTGQRLDVGTLQTSDPGMDLSGVTLGATQVTASLAVAQSVPTGTQTLTFANAIGTARIGLLVAPTLPVLTVEPSPLALPPDNTPRQITIRLSGADVVDHGIAVTSSDTTKATVSPGSVIVAAGQTVAQVSVTPRAAGFVSLVLSSSTLNTLTVPVFVTSDFRGVNTSSAQPVGVVVGSAQEPTTPPSTTGTFTAARVGIAVGPVLTGIAPQGMPVGTNQSLTIAGTSIPGTVQLSFMPPQGITATWTVDASGNRIDAALVIDSTAAAGVRRVSVKDGAGNLIPFADPARSQLTLTTGQPAIASIAPLFATPGTSPRILVRGTHLQNGRLVITPSIDLQIDSAPVVNADGTELTAGVRIAALAATGPRLVQVATPSGISASTADASNQLTIVTQVVNDVTPIFAPLVGVVVGGSTGSQGTTTFGPVVAPQVGVIVGAAAHSVTPSVGVLGTTLSLVVSGEGLQSVQTVTFAGPTGASMGAFTVNAEGTRLTIPVTVDAGATRGTRRVVLATASGRLAFTPPTADQFQVVAPAPEVDSIAPQVLVAGQTTVLSVRGKNFTDVSGVRFDPPGGLAAVSTFTATEGNTILSFGVQVTAGTPSGTRTVIIDTAGGPSSAIASPANTVHVAQQVGPTYATIAAPNVGVTVGVSVPPQVTETLGVYAPLVGVVYGSVPVETTRTDSVYASNVGVVVGLAATGITPRVPEGFLKGATGSLTVDGFALDQVTGVTVTGTAGITAGVPVVNGSATQLTIPLTVAADAPSASYGVRLTTGSGTATLRVTASDPAAVLFNVGALPGSIASVAPIVLEQGKSYSFTVRGTNLRDVYQVFADPAAGANFGVGMSAVQWSTDSLGEKLTVPLLIDSNAAIGSRTVRFRVPGGVTSPDATPSNTITIVAPQ